ncbi:hypothetical protein [Flavobacterium pedocola]
MISYWNKKIKSGALQFTVFIGVLIALLLSGLILYAYTFFYTKEQSKGAISNILIVNSAFNFLLQDSDVLSDTLTLNQFSSGNQSLKYNLSQWGLFEKATVIAEHRKKRFVKTAFLGGNVQVNQSPSLFLQENQNPLSVVGNTMIKGTVFLPSQGVKPGYISGQSYYGSQLVYGQVKKSTTKLPELKKSYFERLMLYSKTNGNEIMKDVSEIPQLKSFNSFKNKTIHFYSKTPITLSDNLITGNIVIKSDTQIRVKRSSVLKDVIIVAPEIEIEDGVEGNFQAIASKQIKVGKECRLKYPSALVVLDEADNSISENQMHKNISIDERSSIDGYVCYFSMKELQESNFKPQVVLMEEASVRGQVYCMGNFELKGRVEGTVYTQQFIVNAGGSIYLNHIFNGNIQGFEKLDYFGGLLFKDTPKTILKWCY